MMNPEILVYLVTASAVAAGLLICAVIGGGRK